VPVRRVTRPTDFYPLDFNPQPFYNLYLDTINMGCRFLSTCVGVFAHEAMGDNIIFEDLFEIKQKDKDGKKFDKGKLARGCCFLFHEPASERV
jgi:hypothetical protein